jgi:hypothetical protein
LLQRRNDPYRESRLGDLALNQNGLADVALHHRKIPFNFSQCCGTVMPSNPFIHGQQKT